MTYSYSTAVIGETAVPIRISVETKRGVPEILLHGIPSRETVEIKQRILMALHHAGIKLRAKRTLITVRRPDLLKQSWIDLAVAATLLYQNSKLTVEPTTAYVGQVQSDGTVSGTVELIPAIIAAKRLGFKSVVIPKMISKYVSWLAGIQVLSIAHLRELTYPSRIVQTPLPASSGHTPISQTHQSALQAYPQATRALQLTAAGGHHLLLLGPPGWGKSTLAQAAATLLPQLSAREVESVLSSSQRTSNISDALRRRPLCHTLTTKYTPTEIFGSQKSGTIGILPQNSHGLLVFDELANFSPKTILQLRSALDFEVITWQYPELTITNRQLTTIIGTGNPCRCGNWKSASSCHCSKSQRKNYWLRIGTALLDRFQLHIWIDEQYSFDSSQTLDIKTLRASITRAREQQRQRFANKLTLNAHAEWEELSPDLTRSSLNQLKQASIQLQLSLRAALHCLRVARSIADLAGVDKILSEHILEALQFRPIITTKDFE